MHYDVVIIGAGMSGLAAGIRLAHFEKSVCIVEKHYAFGGLNSYYRLDGRDFDVGLHAVTNYSAPHDRAAPLNKLFRQLRLKREDFDLRPQRYSEIRFPNHRLRFTNDIEDLLGSVAGVFPNETDGFRKLVDFCRTYDVTNLHQPYRLSRPVLNEFLRDPVLIDMLLCPIMYYGSAEEHDMDLTQFITLFHALFLEGFARPPEGVRRIIRTLVRRFRACGGKLKMQAGVKRIDVDKDRATALELETGETLTADAILSSAGYFETMSLCSGCACPPPKGELGAISFVETIGVLSERPDRLGHPATIVFFNDAPTFTYARPDDPVDLRSGVICCPSNYEGHEVVEPAFRVTWLANHDPWAKLDETSYQSLKAVYRDRFMETGERYIHGFGSHVVYTDAFTPRTIQRYTGHVNGAVYGAPRKIRDGRTRLKNLFICGTDQGYLGIVGAMLSGITMANMHVLEK